MGREGAVTVSLRKSTTECRDDDVDDGKVVQERRFDWWSLLTPGNETDCGVLKT